MVGVVVLVVVAFVLGRETAPGGVNATPAVTSPGPKGISTTSPTTTGSNATTTTNPQDATTTTSPTTGPTLATCTAAVTGFYFPQKTPAVQLGGLSTVQRIGYACQNQAILSDAMKTAGNGTVYNGDVVTVAQDVCNDYPKSPLCVNG